MQAIPISTYLFPGHQIDKSRGMRHAVFIHMVNLRPDTFLLKNLCTQNATFYVASVTKQLCGEFPTRSEWSPKFAQIFVSSGLKGSIIAHHRWCPTPNKNSVRKKKETSVLDLGKATMLGKNEPKHIFSQMVGFDGELPLVQNKKHQLKNKS